MQKRSQQVKEAKKRLKRMLMYFGEYCESIYARLLLANLFW